MLIIIVDYVNRLVSNVTHDSPVKVNNQILLTVGKIIITSEMSVHWFFIENGNICSLGAIRNNLYNDGLRLMDFSDDD